MGWGSIQDDDGVFGDDGFGDPSADCFGRALEDIDPFGGNDSFDRDPDWTTAIDNGDSSGRDKDTNTRSRKSTGSAKRGKKSGSKVGEVSHSSEISPKHEKRTTKSSKHISRTEDSTTQRARKTKSPLPSGFGSFDNVTSVEQDDFDPFAIGLEASSVSSPSTTDDTSCRKGVIDDGFGDFASFDAFPQAANRKTQASPHSSPGTHSAARSSRRITSMVPRSPMVPTGRDPHRPNHYQEGNGWGGDVMDNPDGNDVHHRPVHSNIYRRRGSLQTGSSREGSQYYVSSPGGRLASGPSKVVIRKDGTARRMLPSEQLQRESHSGSRRSAVKDALFSSLGHEVDDAKQDIPLSAFLNSDKTGRGAVRRASENGSVGEHSTQSAPAADRDHYRQRHRQNREHQRGELLPPSRAGSSEHNRVPGSPSSPVGGGAGSRSRRSTARRTTAPTGRDTTRRKSDPTSGGGPRKEKVSVDVAQLAEQGYIEVVDGRMRLVVDLEMS